MKKYLLEHYPLIWSTRAVPMLIVALGAHLLFFLLGLIASNRGGMGFAEDFWALPFEIYRIGLIVFFVKWLMDLYRFNAFNWFYPNSPLKLFGTFALFFLVTFSVIGLPVTFALGVLCTSSFAGTENSDLTNIYFFITKAPFSLFALGIALIIFCVYITKLRTFLLTIVFTSVLALILAMLCIIIAIVGNIDFQLVVWIYLFTYFAVALVSVIGAPLLPKLYSGILICFSLLLFPAAIFTIALLKVDIDQFSQSLYYQLLAVAFLFIFLYNYHIQQWKAMPE